MEMYRRRKREPTELIFFVIMLILFFFGVLAFGILEGMEPEPPRQKIIEHPKNPLKTETSQVTHLGTIVLTADAPTEKFEEDCCEKC